MLDKTRSYPESSTFSVGENGDLMLTLRGKLYPEAGGVECGGSLVNFNFSEHIRKIIREELSHFTAAGQAPSTGTPAGT